MKTSQRESPRWKTEWPSSNSSTGSPSWPTYHANAQLDLTLNGDTASGVSYCLVTLIGMENGKRMKTSMLVIYNDSYVRQDGTWLIADRKSNFVTREQEEIK
jgi:hypothetical protein